jgi:hypothetical protein
MARTKLTKSQISAGNIDFTDSGAGAGVNFTGASTALADVAGVTTTYTSGSTPERLYLWLSFMAEGSAANVNTFFSLNVNSVDLDNRFFTALNGVWLPISQFFKADIPANTTVTIKARYKVSSGTVVWGRDSSDVGFRSKIQGFAVAQ